MSKFERTAGWASGLLTFGWGMLALISCIYASQFGECLTSVALFISVIVAVIVLAIASKSNIAWSIFIRLWIETNWKNRHFQQEVDEILVALVGYQAGRYMLHRLEGTREEVECCVVPKHIRDACAAYLINSAKDIKYVGKPQNPILAILPDHAKSSLRRSFETYKKFKIIPEDVRLDFYYNEAKKLIELEKAKAAVPA